MKNIEKVIKYQEIIILFHFIKANGFEIEIEQITNLICEDNRQKNISFLEISETLTKLSVSHNIIKIEKSAIIPKKHYPYITFLNDFGFVVINSVKDNYINLFTCKFGDIKLNIEKLNIDWCGILLYNTQENKKRRKKREEEKVSVNIYNSFISNEDCDFFIDYCEINGLFKKSTIDILTTGSNDIRTSKSSIIFDRNIEIIDKIYNKVMNIFNIKMEQIENIQCVKYDKNEQFKLHIDSSDENRRTDTILIYLNDNFVGGETFFPIMNNKIIPKKGEAIHFVSRENNFDKLISIHAGLPIISGTKYACNIWFSRY